MPNLSLHEKLLLIGVDFDAPFKIPLKKFLCYNRREKIFMEDSCASVFILRRRFPDTFLWRGIESVNLLGDGRRLLHG